jgi:trypsin
MRRWLFAWGLAACAAPIDTSVAQPVTAGAPDAADPAVVALVDATDQVGCTATMIGPHTAITAAHCIADRDPRGLRVVFGTSVADGGVFDAVSDGRAHPAFDATTLANDVAMLTVRDASPVAPLALDPEPLDASLIGTTMRVVGFGTTGAGLTDGGIARAGTARITDVQVDELVVAPDPSQPCRGDSGGPALLVADAVAAVVSHGDAACTDHANYARIDVARTILVDRYLADTAPGTASVGDACFYDGHCADGPCLVTHDDAELFFCSHACQHDSDCPAAMTCAPDGCRYPQPSPGALGSPCTGDAQCTSQICHAQVCTRSCLTEVCPTDFECRDSYCVATSGCGCASGSGAPGILVLIAFARVRRSGRRASPRDSRAARSR